MQRSQFTFYESFRRALSRIKKAADRAAAYDAIADYALYGIEPDYDNLPDAAALAFDLIKPTLDASSRKASNGKKGGAAKQDESDGKPQANGKQTASKPQANGKQTASEKEKEKEKEKENECYNPQNPLEGRSDALCTAFADWLTYKSERKEGYKATGLKSLITEVKNNADRHGDDAVAAIIRLSMASGWKGICFDKLTENAGKPAVPTKKGGNYEPGVYEREAVARRLAKGE